MASLRTHTRIARSADDVWNAMSDARGISTWFSGIEQRLRQHPQLQARRRHAVDRLPHHAHQGLTDGRSQGSPKPSPAREWT